MRTVPLRIWGTVVGEADIEDSPEGPRVVATRIDVPGINKKLAADIGDFSSHLWKEEE